MIKNPRAARESLERSEAANKSKDEKLGKLEEQISNLKVMLGNATRVAKDAMIKTREEELANALATLKTVRASVPWGF